MIILGCSSEILGFIGIDWSWCKFIAIYLNWLESIWIDWGLIRFIGIEWIYLNFLKSFGFIELFTFISLTIACVQMVLHECNTQVDWDFPGCDLNSLELSGILYLNHWDWLAADLNLLGLIWIYWDWFEFTGIDLDWLRISRI
jgi:hypothetical protein